MARIKMKRPAEAITLESAFKEFVIAQSAKGVAEKTLKTYHSHFRAAGKHIDTEKTFAELQKYDLDQMVVSMREAGLAHNSISSYVRVTKIIGSYLLCKMKHCCLAQIFCRVIMQMKRLCAK